MNKISMDKKYKTRDGRDVRVLEAAMKGANGSFRAVCLTASKTDPTVEISYSVNADTGQIYVRQEQHFLDLIEHKPIKKIEDLVLIVYYDSFERYMCRRTVEKVSLEHERIQLRKYHCSWVEIPIAGGEYELHS